MKRLALSLVVLAVYVWTASVFWTASAQDPRTLLKENPERLAGVHHRYEAPVTIVDTPAPKGYKPFYISHYGRHGCRYMTSTSTMDKILKVLDPIADKGLFTEEGMSLYRDFKELRDAHEGMSGYLTQKGAAEHQGIAHRLHDRVPGGFHQKDRYEVMAASSIIQRCVQSMAAFTGEIRSLEPKLDVKLYTGDRYMDYILHESAKKKDSAVHKRIVDSLLSAHFNPDRMMKACFNDPAEAEKYFGKYDAAHLFFDIFYEAGITQCLDENLHSVLNYFTEDELYGLWYADNAKVYNNEGFTVENESNRIETASHILRDIIEKADEAVAGNHRAADLRFGHDSGLLPLLSLMGVDGLEVRNMAAASEPNGLYIFDKMPMCSNLQMIFYRDKKGDILVKILRNEKETLIPGLTPVTGPYYRWDNLREYLAAQCGARNFRLLYWNIQNGMWDGQTDNYERFVSWVREQNPDICVWCEGQTIYYSGTDKPMKAEERFLVNGWNSLAARYGHSYVYVGGHRDDYPQVITSRYPIENVSRIIGHEPDSVVTHGAGWATVEAFGKKVNVVTLHTWPQKWAFRAFDQEASKDAGGGDRYRKMEMEYICNHTILSHPDAADELWMMMGDHNARSRVDNDVYGYEDDDTRFFVHDYILQNTPYIDVVKDQHPDTFSTTLHGKGRIDFVYVSPALNNKVVDAHVVYDAYTEPVRNPEHISNFWHPSDHRPIIVDFNL